MVVVVDMLRAFYENKSRVLSAVVARRKLLAINDGYLVFSSVLAIMDHSVDTGMFY
jgi:hypothetical protein